MSANPKKLLIRAKNSASLREILSCLSRERFELIKCIREDQPGSLYELSQLSKKSQPYTHKEVLVLKELGLVEIVLEKRGGRKVSRPVVKYSVLEIEISL